MTQRTRFASDSAIPTGRHQSLTWTTRSLHHGETPRAKHCRKGTVEAIAVYAQQRCMQRVGACSAGDHCTRHTFRGFFSCALRALGFDLLSHSLSLRWEVIYNFISIHPFSSCVCVVCKLRCRLVCLPCSPHRPKSKKPAAPKFKNKPSTKGRVRKKPSKVAPAPGSAKQAAKVAQKKADRASRKKKTEKKSTPPPPKHHETKEQAMHLPRHYPPTLSPPPSLAPPKPATPPIPWLPKHLFSLSLSLCVSVCLCRPLSLSVCL